MTRASRLSSLVRKSNADAVNRYRPSTSNAARSRRRIEIVRLAGLTGEERADARQFAPLSLLPPRAGGGARGGRDGEPPRPVTLDGAGLPFLARRNVEDGDEALKTDRRPSRERGLHVRSIDYHRVELVPARPAHKARRCRQLVGLRDDPATRSRSRDRRLSARHVE